MKKNALLLVVLLLVPVSSAALAAESIYVAVDGRDENPGSTAQPVATLAHACELARTMRTKTPGTIEIVLRGGTHYLEQTLVLSAADSGTKDAPLVITAAPGETAVISGGKRLQLVWKAGANEARVLEAATPPGLVMDQLWINGQRQTMARFPNRIAGKNVFDRWDLSHGGRAEPDEDAMSRERIARWKNPAGGYVHAMHPALWGDMHWRIKGKKADGNLDLEGGWQNNRPGPMHGKFRFVENIREELDAPGEWFHDAAANVLYYIPEPGVDLNAATVEVVRLAHLIEFKGSKEKPVQFIELRGLTFRHAARTFMDNKEPLLRSDWTVYRGGAVVFDGAADCVVADSTFDQVGGNTIFVNNWNRRIAVRGCLIKESGANGVAYVGDPKAVRNPLFRYGPQNYDKIDRTPGPQTENYPADCVVEDCLITRTGRDEKQTAGVHISMSQSITVRHCSIYDVPRAGININEGTWGGHLIEFCDVFNTVLETGDHGSFNSWGRDRYWTPGIGEMNTQVAADPKLPLLDVVKPIIMRNNRWRCDHGWDVDLDDGSTNYEIYNNLMLHGGLKLREGFERKVHNNITVNNSLHPHCWFDQSHDEVSGNIFMGAYRPAGGMPKGKWGNDVDRNFFTAENFRTAFSKNGCDANSIAGDPQFVDPAKLDFRVKDTSPALKIGFKNFPMDQFGVQKPELKKLAKTPEPPGTAPEPVAPRTPTKARATISTGSWLQASVKALEGEEFSAFGVARDAGGLQLIAVPAGSAASKAGLKKDDLLMSLNGVTLKNAADLNKAMDAARGQPMPLEYVRNQQPQKLIIDAYPIVVVEASEDGTFKTIPLAAAGQSLAIAAITTQPATSNEPVATLLDGKLAENYGPVIGNGQHSGLYKVDLGKAQPIREFNAWSYSLGARGAQKFTLYGSTSEADPGWKIDDATLFTPIAEVNANSAVRGKFGATSVRHSTGAELGTYRWLILAAHPLNGTGEHTAFQEVQVK